MFASLRSLHLVRPLLRSSRAMAAALLLAAPAVAFSQTPTGRITGMVTDPSGSVVPSARVEAVNTATGIQTPGLTNESGIYQLNFLIPGRYDVTAAAGGFRKYLRREVIVETGGVMTLDVVMQLGETSESVTVTGETPLLQTERTSVSQIVESASVTNLPIASRRVGALMRMLGTVTYVSENLTFGWADFSVAGGRGRQQNWSLDGGTIHGVPMFTGVANANPPMDAIEELKVETNNYPAEYGRTTGGFVIMTTKSGTNRFRGALYEYLRNNAFDARNFFAASVAPRRYNVFGGTLGGPVVKNKLFFFFSGEATRRRDGVTRSYGVPTVAEVSGNFSQTAGALLDPLTGSPVPGNVLPASRIDPVGGALAKFYPVPNAAGARSGANNFIVNAVNSQDGDNYVARLDYNPGTKDRLSARYLNFRGRDTPQAVFETAAADPNSNRNDVRSTNFSPALMHTFSPTLLSETRASILWRTEFTPLGEASGIAGRLGIPGVNPIGMPRINVLNYSSLGNTPQYRHIGPFRSTQITQSISWFRGKHTLKFGGEGRRSSTTDNQLLTRSGLFSFNDVATGRGFALAALLLGWTQNAQVITGNVSSRMEYYGLYVQDDWKVTNRLTLNLGLRWEMDTPWYEGFNRRSSFDPNALNPVSGTRGDVVWQDVNKLGKYAHSFDRNNFGPRFGFAWRPLGDRTVLRGGYGLIYGGIYDGSMGRVFDAGYGDQRDFTSPDNGITPATLLRNGVPVAVQPPRVAGFRAVLPGQTPSFSPDFALPDQRSPYSHQANFNVQHELPSGFLLEAGWLANLSHKIAGRDININEVRPELRGATQDQRLRPFPQYAGVLVRNPNWGNSSYHALALKVQKRYSRGLSLLSTYTWSKFLDDVNATVEATSSGPQSYYDRHSDKAPSGNDIRHRFTGTAVYELPFGPGKALFTKNRIVDGLLQDWSVSGFLDMRTGFYFGVVELSNRLNAFSSRQRSSVVGAWEMSGDQTKAAMLQQYFNTSAFAFPGAGVPGNTARAFIPGPGAVSLDASMQRDIRFGERLRFQLRGEAYNALNRANFGNPNVSRGASAFGQIGSTSSARILQLGARLEF